MISCPESAALYCARRTFPAGLLQPEGCARFSMDTLLLGAFAARTLHALPAAKRGPFLELGCGIGAALFTVALLYEEGCGVGLDMAGPLTAAARDNSRLLGLSGRIDIVDGVLPERCTLRRCREWLAAHCGSLEAAVILANPPYWEQREGRSSARQLVDTARRMQGATLDEFCFSASRLLRHKGAFCCVYDARFLSRLLEACTRHELGVRRIVPVHPRKGSPARRVLLEARKGAAHDLQIEEALYLHPSDAAASERWTSQALSFCPFLERSL